MILACPSCAAKFLVEDSAIGVSGRQVRCGRCKHEWFATLPADAAVAAASAEAVTIMPPPRRPRPIPPGSNLPAVVGPPRRSAAAVVGWILLVLVVAAVAGLVLARDSLMAAVPALKPLYDTVGLGPPLPGEGLQLEDVGTSSAVQEGVSVILVEGRIRNISTAPRLVPALRGALRDEQKRDLQSWTFTVPSPRLAPGEAVAFRTEVRRPSTPVAEMSITFQAN
jgi:predicted Zn finger-like uncharacterized protein